METTWIVLLTQLVLLHTVSGSIENVALHQPVSASSMWSGYNASTAVDGNTDAGGYGVDQIIDTGTGHNFAWWKVDLEREVQDAIVRIYFRTDFKIRRNGVELYTCSSDFTSYPGSEDQLCHTVTGRKDGSDIADVYNVTCPGTGRYLLIYTNTSNNAEGPSLDFGEVEVNACSDETYGKDCAKRCTSRNCVTMTTTCERDGRCSDGCQPGWTGVDCAQACDSGYYGPSCRLLCSDLNCLKDSTECNHTTGQCLHGCQPGYKALNCTEECESGTYGDGCSLSCTDRNCSDSSSECDHVIGQCKGGCQAGSRGTDCKQACDLGVNYGVNCLKSCPDRHCNQPSECDTRTGQCIGGCQVGWTGVDCTSQCPAGTFGSNCTLCTTRHCQGESCPVDGTCSQGCQDGWTGNTCLKKCSQDLYGPRCTMVCGNCSSDSTCHHVTGSCPSGCKAGWITEKCNEVCIDGSYGPDCTEKCGKCDGVCDRVDGRCPAGCLNGYCGIKCDVDLGGVDGNFGVGSLVGAVVGTFILVVVLGVGIIICLIREGRLQWMKSSNRKQIQEVHNFTHISSNAPRPAEASEHSQSINHDYNNDYSVLDSGTKTDYKDYDSIKPKHYQNL